MNLHELGEMFRIERERHGLTQMDVAQQTKISISNIKAIEQGRKEALPHPVYAKGFVKNYAKLLGLNENELADVMNREYHVEEDNFGDSPGMEKPVTMPHRTRAGKKSKLPVVLLLIVLLGALSGLVWYAMSGKQAAEPQAASQEEIVQPETPAPAPEAEPPAPEPQAVDPQAGMQPSRLVPAAESEAQAEQAPAAPAEPVQTPDAGAETVREEPAEAEAMVRQTPVAAAPAQGYEVLVKASELCWIYGVVDNGEPTDVTLRPGESKSFLFNESLTLRLGNAGGVDVFVNGEEHDFEAVSGQVKTLVFP